MFFKVKFPFPVVALICSTLAFAGDGPNVQGGNRRPPTVVQRAQAQPSTPAQRPQQAQPSTPAQRPYQAQQTFQGQRPQQVQPSNQRPQPVIIPPMAIIPASLRQSQAAPQTGQPRNFNPPRAQGTPHQNPQPSLSAAAPTFVPHQGPAQLPNSAVPNNAPSDSSAQTLMARVNVVMEQLGGLRAETQKVRLENEELRKDVRNLKKNLEDAKAELRKVDADEGFLGEIRYSLLEEDEFQRRYGRSWVLFSSQTDISQTDLARKFPQKWSALPDARGCYLRAANHGRGDGYGIPEGEVAIGGFLCDTFKRHTHTDAGHTHPHGFLVPTAAGQGGAGASRGSGAGWEDMNLKGGIQAGQAQIQETGDAETRPKSIVVNVYIKVNE